MCWLGYPFPDGIPNTIDKEEGPMTRSRSKNHSKLQALLQNVQEVQGDAYGLAHLKVPGFVHAIT